ncbi:CGNR zinc finger domain-containing protein [Streptomyces mirabilis]|uniref:CGNR zinc finger domain-containing protein n=2 Tax=Streptomyces TaxID=1883 RepID=UPI0036C75957
MNWPAIERFNISPAPGGLAAVQDLLSSRARYDGTPDLLATVSSAQAWADALTSSWAQVTGSPSPRIRFKAGDLEPLRVLRAELVDAVRERTAVEPSRSQAVGDLPGNTLLAGIPLTASIGQDGSVALRLAGIGWQAMAGLVAVELFAAQTRDTWRRLKTCRNELCPGAFFDRSPNNSGVWHDVRTCGNVANLRASRQRRRKHA